MVDENFLPKVVEKVDVKHRLAAAIKNKSIQREHKSQSTLIPLPDACINQRFNGNGGQQYSFSSGNTGCRILNSVELTVARS